MENENMGTILKYILAIILIIICITFISFFITAFIDVFSSILKKSFFETFAIVIASGYLLVKITKKWL
jgi:hypothetical protein